jgi:glycosyltransferase involved in cell wall biosynthesis
MKTKNILVISIDTIGSHLGGAGLRYLAIAKGLADAGFCVKLAVPNPDFPQIDSLEIFQYQHSQDLRIKNVIRETDIIIASGYLIEKIKYLRNCQARLVLDLYDPFLLENLFYNQDLSEELRSIIHLRSVSITNQLMRWGDFYLCGNERQRDFWLGVLAANGRINPLQFISDPTFYGLIDIMPVGIEQTSIATENYLIGRHTSFPIGSKIILWGGGVWDWLDPLPLIKVWKAVLRQHPQARLVFLGLNHPNPSVPLHKKSVELQKEIKKSGELNSSIFLFDWLDYEDRKRLLAEAHIGVTLYDPHIETRFSIRTRVIDYFSAGLPVLINAGDILADWIKTDGGGMVVDAYDIQGLETTLVTMLYKEKSEFKDGLECISARLIWKNNLQPLINYCRSGDFAADRTWSRKMLPNKLVLNSIDFSWIILRLQEMNNFIRTKKTRSRKP